MYKVLTDYEVGRCSSAIEAVVLLGKPIVEVMTRKAVREELEADLKQCLEMGRKLSRRVKYFVLPAGSRFRYGFYLERWTLEALIFLEGRNLSGRDRAWVSGLLFGYTPGEIQKFINRTEPSRRRKGS